MRVDGKRQALDWNARLGMEIGDVALGVHARVRAAAADELDVPAADLREALSIVSQTLETVFCTCQP